MLPLHTLSNTAIVASDHDHEQPRKERLGFRARLDPRTILQVYIDKCPAFILTCFIVANAYLTVFGTQCLLYNLQHGMFALGLLAPVLYELTSKHHKRSKWYFLAFVIVTLTSAAVVGAMLALGREGSRQFGSTDKEGEQGLMMSARAFVLVMVVMIVGVAGMGMAMMELARKVAEREPRLPLGSV
ncbi:hypothetical protein BCR44DRAFT_41111 [Catenaria anguillulae PL171]|uniref:Uncharacterized protein n=1 Tax=Catenaria anguillulae PL171 TaxID=765915 RepID=A0A1Y2HFM6_9FUNG|nr:hypothetical protein BCR44DRAFT_41111 [Catenaria anguillulae PL171]